MDAYTEMSKTLLEMGINIYQYFEYNNKIYSVNIFFEKFYLLPIHIRNYNYILYKKDFIGEQYTEISDFLNSFYNIYGISAYRVLYNYVDYLSCVCNIQILENITLV